MKRCHRLSRGCSLGGGSEVKRIITVRKVSRIHRVSRARRASEDGDRRADRISDEIGIAEVVAKIG
jgi:hypothetical protein